MSPPRRNAGPRQLTSTTSSAPSPFATSASTAWLSWNNGTVRRLAETAYDARLLPSGELDRARLAVFADALEEASCTDADLLAHLRSDGPHVHRCFAIDALLCKD